MSYPDYNEKIQTKYDHKSYESRIHLNIREKF